MGEKEKITHYQAVPELDEKYRKKKIVVNDGAKAFPFPRRCADR